MRVRVGHGLVGVAVLVMLSEVQPDTHGHEGAGDGELRSDRLAERDHRRRSAEKRCGGEICAGARGPEMAQGHDEECQARAVAEEPDEPAVLILADA